MTYEEKICVWCGESFNVPQDFDFPELEEYDYLLCLLCTIKAPNYEQFVRSLGFTEYNHLEYLHELKSRRNGN